MLHKKEQADRKLPLRYYFFLGFTCGVIGSFIVKVIEWLLSVL